MEANNILALLELQVSGVVPPIEVLEIKRADMEPVPLQNILAQMEVIIPIIPEKISFQLIPEPEDADKGE